MPWGFDYSVVGVALAGDPHAAYYSADNDKIFWFIQVTDTHIGARGSQDSDNLLWLVTQGKNIVNPEFIVVSGDLTDSTNGNWLGLPNGPYQAEWDEYRSILSQGNIDSSNYYDLPGNHDAYNDQYFNYYLSNSIQGQGTNATQVSWTRQFSYGKYHFLGVNTADNTGDSFSLFWPWGDYAGLDTDELSYIQDDLSLNTDANLTFVFGHHPVTDTGDAQDTWLYYGASDFLGLIDQHTASLYGYGHTHQYSEELFKGDTYTGYMAGDGFVYLNISSLGKSTENNFSVIAIDCNGVATKTQNMGVWPLVLITTPVNHDLGGVSNPYSYTVPNAASNPIRALVFDNRAISQVQYRVDNDSQWHPMQPVVGNPYLWEAMWDGSAAAEGGHTIQVQAVGSTVQSDTIAVQVASSNQPPVAQDQNVNTNEDTNIPILLTASDADGDTLRYEVVLPPAHGILEGSPPTLTYSPDPDYFGSDSFTFKAFDGNTYSNEAVVTLTIAPINGPPVAVNDTYTVDQGQVLTIPAPGVLANDTDVDGGALTASVLAPTGHGTLNFSANGAFIYTPDSGFVGADSFTYVALDGSVVSSPATVGITVSAAAEMNFSAESETVLWGTVEGSYLDTYADDGTYEKLTEEVKAGRWSVLEHTWTFSVSGGPSVAFLVQAHHNDNTEGDDFVFAYSLDNITFFDMVVVSETSDDGGYQRFDLPAYTSGTIYVRVTDTDMSKGNVSPDTLFVDDMHIVTSSIAGMPSAAFDPNPADGASGIATNSWLTWSPGSNALWHDVYFGTGIDPGNLLLVSAAQTSNRLRPRPIARWGHLLLARR